MTTRNTPLVLVVDDEEDLRELVAYRLRKARYEVRTAHDGVDAYEKAVEELPDLIVMDIMMPKMDGLETTRQLRADQRTDAIPIILLTAKVQEEDVNRGFAAGADDYLRKPFSPQELQSRVRAILGRR